MTRSKIMRIVLVIGSVLIIVGVSLMGWMMATEEDRTVISVNLSNENTQAFGFEGLALVPGDSCAYTLAFDNQNADQYQLELSFVEKEEKTLKHYARVEITDGEGVVLYDELLATAFEGDAIVLPVDFDKDINTSLQVRYYLPLDVGNEAKRAEAVFELQIKASNE